MSIEGRYVELSHKRHLFKVDGKVGSFPFELIKKRSDSRAREPQERSRLACPVSPRNAIFREIKRFTYSDVGTSLYNSIKKNG